MNKNKIKKYLGIKKNQLILLAVYKKFGIEFKDTDDACDWVSTIILEEEVNGSTSSWTKCDN